MPGLFERGDVSQIFISYAREDLTQAERLAEGIEAYGWSVWWDRSIPAGKNFSTMIEAALAEAQCVVVLWSTFSISSDWVLEEAEEGRNRGILIPVLLDSVNPPIGFRRLQAADLTEWDGTHASAKFRKLMDDISIIMGAPPNIENIENTRDRKEVETSPTDLKRPLVQEEKSEPQEVVNLAIEQQAPVEPTHPELADVEQKSVSEKIHRIQMDSKRGWVMVGAAFIAISIAFGISQSSFILFNPIINELGVERKTLSLIFTMISFLSWSLGLASGLATDRFGPRRILSVGAGIMGIGLILTSKIDQIWLGYLTYGIAVGAGIACIFVPMLATVGGWFERRLALAMGIAVTGFVFGPWLMTSLLSRLLELYGWRTACVVLGLALSAVLSVCILMVTKPSINSVKIAPVGLGVAVRTATFKWLYFAGFLSTFSLSISTMYLHRFVTEREVAAIASLFSWLAFSGVAGRIGLGALGDRFGRLRLFRFGALLLGISHLLWLTAGSSYPMLVAFTLLMGIGSGGFSALSPAVLTQSFGLTGLGGIMGAYFTGYAAASLIAGPLAGMLYDLTNSQGMVIALAMAPALASFLCLLKVKSTSASLPDNNGHTVEFHKNDS